MSDNRPEIDYKDLNPLGKVVYVTGATVRFMTEVLETGARAAGVLLDETSRAFREGLDDDPDVTDATIISESDRESKNKKSGRSVGG